ncbi:Por secretion system C-terminal sorting domain-containing protein [Chryseobacterium soldanellicola]|uniref:Por secretion system C-terminal sorting domain-containing protein n=1 Tax=Chryseobacterium soldanellicola TaxID=311333 RepID=A0A1H0XZD1_9FLAO|nr:T9SS type A sorting domain-containing protein [Chryseobacterium soldanellicola]SDQ08161.1 Por secretion system C-terminal sorting domain-containing protein [Chryseobacterium soldanellicola]
MKKNKTLRKWVMLFFCFIISNNFAQISHKDQDSYSLGKNADFLRILESQLTTNLKKENQKYPEIQLAVSNSDILDAKINYQEKQSAHSIHWEGEILGNHSGTFSIELKNNKLEGRIILLKSRKAYIYYSDEAGNAFIKEIDINNIICTDLSSPPPHLKGKKTTNSGKSVNNINVYNLQSFPGASGCLLLDFDGHTVLAGSGWNGGNPIIAAPSGMSDANILETWEIVAEDFRPFNLNITTDENVFNTYPQNKRKRCVITPTDIASPGGVGLALINSFSSPSDLPCWVFTSAAGTSAQIVGEVASHELGHTFGLKHDGLSQYSYYSGHGDWAPIMGSNYYKKVTQWSKGEYTNATNHEDDVSIISSSTNGIGYRTDAHGDTFATATILNSSGAQISGSQNQGIIEQTGDIDMFKFNTNGGNTAINIQAVERHSDLRLKVSLYDEKNVLIVSYNADPADLSAPITINVNLSAGNYYLAVTNAGDGNADTGFTHYASLGAYNIFGSVSSFSPALGTIETTKNDQIRIYPNPTRDELTIDFGSFSGNHQVEIISAVQQIIYKTTTSEKILKVSIADKSPGIYFVIVKNKSTGFNKSFSIIKQ